MNCYSCDTNEGLSIKARHRDGSIRLMICKPCRNKLQKKYKPKSRVERITFKNRQQWDTLAKLINGRIAEKYAHGTPN